MVLPPVLATESSAVAPTTVSRVVEREVSAPPMEAATEPESAPDYRPDLPARWLTEETRHKVAEGIVGQYRDTCKYCKLTAPTRRLRIHVRQHFIRYYCPCGFNRVSRDSVGDHQRKNSRGSLHGGTIGKTYEVDKASYPALCRAMEWEEPEPFQDCTPNLQPREQPTEARPKRRRRPPSSPASANPGPAQKRTRHTDARAQIQVRRIAVPAPATEEATRESGPVADTVYTLLQQADLLEASARTLRRQAQSLTHRPLEYRPPRR